MRFTLLRALEVHVEEFTFFHLVGGVSFFVCFFLSLCFLYRTVKEKTLYRAKWRIFILLEWFFLGWTFAPHITLVSRGWALVLAILLLGGGWILKRTTPEVLVWCGMPKNLVYYGMLYWADNSWCCPLGIPVGVIVAMFF